MYFQRIAESHLNDWLAKNSRKPLVIRGARQVGKTALVRAFAANQNLDLVEINLEEDRISEFGRGSFDVNRCINEILALKSKRLSDRTLIFIDEIQESDDAYSRLRFFKEQRPEIPVIAAGSLLEVRLREKKQKIPVGRIEYLFLGPFVFSEFLRACGGSVLAGELESVSPGDHLNKLTSSVHERIVRYLMDYFFVGGMPEAVLQFVKSGGSYVDARSVHHQIIQAFREDVDRYAEGHVADIIRDVLDRIPFEIGHKVIFSRLSQAKSIQVKQAIDILDGIFLLQKVYHTSGSGIPLRRTEDPDVFKTYFLDVGLYNCLLDVTWNDISGLDYENLISKGDMAEQFAAQHLYLGSGRTDRPRVYYWLREKSSDNAEVDFLRCYRQQIIPIEIKAGKSGRIKSLVKFMADHAAKSKHAIRFDLAYRERFVEQVDHGTTSHGGQERGRFTLFNLPLYGIERIDTLNRAMSGSPNVKSLRR